MHPPLESQLTLAAVASFFLQVLKRTKWFPLLSEESSRAMKIVFALIASAATSLGISYAYDPQAHTLLIAGLSLAGIVNHAWDWLQQFVFQEGWYQMTKKNGARPASGGGGGEGAEK